MQRPDAVEWYPDAARCFRNETLRQLVYPTFGGPRIRVWLSNEYGTAPLRIGHASVARGAGRSAVLPESLMPLTFGGRGSVLLWPGTVVVSDPAPMPIAHGDAVALSMYLPESTIDRVPTVHQDGGDAAYAIGTGDLVMETNPQIMAELYARYYLSGLDVEAAECVGTIICVGDSITDGFGLARNSHARWPDQLARRLQAARTNHTIINMGISGNRLLQRWTGPSVLARLDRDVLSIPAIRTVLLAIGINDLAGPEYLQRPDEIVSVEDLIAGLRQTCTRVHDHGARAIVCTLAPCGGADFGYGSESTNRRRRTVNDWIRATADLDDVIDFDKILRDPTDATRLRPDFDSGDRLHPNAAGHAAIAANIDLNML